MVFPRTFRQRVERSAIAVWATIPTLRNSEARETFTRLLFLLAVLAASIVCPATAASPVVNLLSNPGFEEPLGQNSWFLDPAVSGKGISGQSVFAVHSGRFSLRLVANSNNTSDPNGNQFGVGQRLAPELYRGKALHFSAWMRGYAGATAVLRMLAVSSSGAVWYRELREDDRTTRPVLRRDV